MKLFITCLVCFYGICSLGQTKVTSISDVNLLGTKKLDNTLLLLSTEGKYIYLTSLGRDGRILWENYFKTTSLSGYHFNKIIVFQSGDTIVLIEHLPKKTVFHLYQELTGREIEKTQLKSPLSSLIYTMSQNNLCNISSNNGIVITTEIRKQGLSSKNKIIEVANTNYHPKFQVHFTSDNKLFSTSRVLESNHGKMHLYLNRLDLETNQIIENEIDLELKASSFTYNSTLDQNVYGVINSDEGFYLLGKLDMAFKRKYPTKKLGEAFTGFWIAKFTDDLEMLYFKEYPFGMFQGLAPNGIIRKATIIELKECKNGSTLIALNNLPAVMYGSKYFVYLNDQGEFGLANSALDEYHFFEKDKKGIRPAGRKLNSRLVNGDWPTYVSNSYLYFTPKPNFFSKELNTIFELKEHNKRVASKKAYAAFNFPENTIYLEYLDKKGGTVNVYLED